jgi:hypothetical protein
MTGLQAAAELTQRLPGLRVLMLSVYIAIRYAERGAGRVTSLRRRNSTVSALGSQADAPPAR